MTSFLEGVRWDLVGGGFQIALCVLILGGWVRRRMKRRPQAGVEARAALADFPREVFLETIRQETEQSHQRILAAVETERDRLQRVLARRGAPHPADDGEPGGSGDARAAFRWGASDADDTDRGRYAGLRGLAEQGLSPRQIADRLHVPAGEVELALKVRGGLQAGERGEGIRQ